MRLDAVAYEQVAKNLKQIVTVTQCPPGLTIFLHPQEGLTVHVGCVQSVSLSRNVGRDP